MFYDINGLYVGVLHINIAVVRVVLQGNEEEQDPIVHDTAGIAR
jgi:hypothetical protein